MARDVRERRRRTRTPGGRDARSRADERWTRRGDPPVVDPLDEEPEVAGRQGRRRAADSLRPGRDYAGVRAFWWLLFWVVIIGLIVWWAWGWGY